MFFPHKGHLCEYTQGGFSKQPKGNIDPLPLSLNLLWLFRKFCLCCTDAFEWLYMLLLVPFCCSRVLWNSWRIAFRGCSARRWGPIRAWKATSSGIWAENQVHFKACHEVNHIPSLPCLLLSLSRGGTLIPCPVLSHRSDQDLHGHRSLLPSYLWAGNKSFYKSRRTWKLSNQRPQILQFPDFP